MFEEGKEGSTYLPSVMLETICAARRGPAFAQGYGGQAATPYHPLRNGAFPGAISARRITLRESFRAVFRPERFPQHLLLSPGFPESASICVICG